MRVFTVVIYVFVVISNRFFPQSIRGQLSRLAYRLPIVGIGFKGLSVIETRDIDSSSAGVNIQKR